MWGCFENPFANDTSLDPRPLPSQTLFSSVDTVGYVWTGKFDLNTDTLGRGNVWIRKEKLRIQKYPDTCGQGLNDGRVISIVLLAHGVNAWPSEQNCTGFNTCYRRFFTRVESNSFFFFFFSSQTTSYYKTTLLISKIILVKSNKRAKRGKQPFLNPNIKV